MIIVLRTVFLFIVLIFGLTSTFCHACSSRDHLPAWVKDRLHPRSGSHPPFVPVEVTSLRYRGNTVYLLVPPCCDGFTEVYDPKGNYLCAPDGGITGRGDGKCPEFSQEATDRKVIWSIHQKESE